MTRRGPLILAAVLFAASLLLFWPGIAMYDTVAQYRQVLTGGYDDWHPPAMARVWRLLAPLGPGAAPMLALQLALYWGGIGAIAATMRGPWAWAIIAIGCCPVFLGWQAVVLKDAQMVGALVAATGLVGWWRLRGRALPAGAVVAAGVLILYATLVRANAAFATVPFVAALVPGPLVRRTSMAAIAIVAVLAALPTLNYRLLGAASSGVERTEAIYDLAGIAARLPPGTLGAGLTAAEAGEVAARRCSRAFFWDPLGEPARCDATVERLRRIPVTTLYLMLAHSALTHPLAYAAHRAAHLNSTERWIVPWRWPGAAPPHGSEPNEVGLGSPRRGAGIWPVVVDAAVEAPIGWPIFWAALAVTGLAVASRGSMAGALFASALTTEASFAVLSIASDLRYHLWAMIATALGLVMVAADGRVSRRAAAAGCAVLALVLVPALAARALLPLPPQTYRGMLG